MASFQKMSEFSEVKEDYEVNIQRSASDDNMVSPRTAKDDYDDDAPGTFSWNPIDWYNDLKKEVQEFNFTMTEKKRVVRIKLA
jgi:hypothetical protein